MWFYCEANQADKKATPVAIDFLMNFKAVKVHFFKYPHAHYSVALQ